MKNILYFLGIGGGFIFLPMVGAAAPADLKGFKITINCQAHSLHGGHPADATEVIMGYWPENGEKAFYIYSGSQMRVGLMANEVRTDARGHLTSNLSATDLDSGLKIQYGTVEVSPDLNGKLQGSMISVYDKTEPYVLGSMELFNCRSFD